MMMKTGFSSSACPAWNLATIVDQASALGFDGVELRGLAGELHLPLVADLVADPDQTRTLFQEKGVELVCLASSASFGSKNRDELGRQKESVIEYLETAGRLGCPFVRAFAGEIQTLDNRRVALSRIGDTLASLSAIAAKHGVTLLIENGGDFSGSEDLWFLVDFVDHPSVQCCWNQSLALCRGERATTSMPRLGGKIGVAHLCDAVYDETGVLLKHTPLGEGQAEIAMQISLLRGMAYDGYLIFDWPKLWLPDLTSPETILPQTATYLRDRVDEKQAVLSAYKGDKRAPAYR